MALIELRFRKPTKSTDLKREDHWYVPSYFLKDNQLIDSREFLEQEGFEVYELARDTRFYKAVPPTGWFMYPSAQDSMQIINNRNECIFVQEIQDGSFLIGGVVYWKHSELANSKG